MPERHGARFSLVARFEEYYEAVAELKLAIAEGRLGALLTTGDEPPPTAPRDLAARASGRLAGLLSAQRKQMHRDCDEVACRAHDEAVYAMAALTDELFILEVDWAGRDVWADVLLERKLFNTRNAGVGFFERAEALLAERERDPLHADLAAVMLLALRLGFKGRYRGPHGMAELTALRARLLKVVGNNYGEVTMAPGFPQALAQLQAGGEQQRLAPLTPWFMGGAVVLVAYLIVSSLIWLWLLEPFRSTVGKG
jgi:type VI secretion system protein ImpK